MVVAGTIAGFGALYGAAKAYGQFNRKKRIHSFLNGGTRASQENVVPSIAGSDIISQKTREIHDYLAAASMAVGLSTAGAVFYSPVSLLSVPLVLYTCRPIFQDACKALFEEYRLRASVLDFVYVVGMLAMGFYVASALSSCLYLLGRKLLLNTQDHSRKRLIDVLSDQPRSVWVSKDGVEVEIPCEDLRVGDTVVVNAGEIVPVDGHIVEGIASLDQHRLTGEAQFAEKGTGVPVFAGTTVLAGRICIQVEKAGAETVAAQIGDILNSLSDFTASMQTRSETFADRLVLPTLGVSAVALSTLGPASAFAVMSADFSEVLGVAAPLSMLNVLDLSARRGILIKDGRSLELLNRVDTIVFDKTGTLTLDDPRVEHIHTCNGLQENELLAYAAAAEARQGHPIARAICQAASARGLALPEMDQATCEVGYGIKAVIAGRRVRLGSARFMEAEGIGIPAAMRIWQDDSHEQGHSLVYVAIGDHLGGAMELQASLRPEVKRILDGLRRRHLKLYLMSGDHPAPTQRLARELGIDQVFAETLPQDKAKLIEGLQGAGRSVCFVGDGLNDAIALKQAHVSISLQGGAAAATETAQIIMMDQSLKRLDEVFDLARTFDTNIKTCWITTLVPGLLCAGGVFFLGFGIFSSVILYNLSLVAGVGNAMLPRFIHAKTLQHQEVSHGNFTARPSRGSPRRNRDRIDYSG
ncbi:MAG: heavy metal translocating P-type ATPase [Methylococcales bacterium]